MPTFAPEAFGGLTGRLVWLSLIHSLWIGLLAASVVALILQSAPRLSHRTRHAILAAAMLVAAVGPIALALWQHLGPSRAPGIAATGMLPTFLVRTNGPSLVGPDPLAEVSSRPQAAGAPPASGPAFASRVPIRFIDALRKVRPVVFGIWSLAMAMLGAILIIGALGLSRLCRGAELAATPLQERSRRLARLLRLRRIPRILVHTHLAEPFLCGVLRPTILLPKGWAGSASARALDAILAHELAHARRRDHVVNLAQRLVEVGLFFHPAVHWLSRSLRRERELCADALAVRVTADPLALAEALESVARLRLEPPRVPAVGTSLGGPSVSLLPRIQELIGMTPSRPRFTVWPLAALPAAGFLALIATAAGLAEDRPSAQVSTPQVSNTYGAPSAGHAVSLTTRPIDPLAAPFEVKGDPRWDVAGGNTVVDDDRQVCFEVRYIVTNANSWRDDLGDKLNLIKREGEVAVWTLDEKAVRDLLVQAQGDARCNILQAPKVTTFNGARATIFNQHKVFYVAGVEKVDTSPAAFRPIVKGLDLGSHLDMTGTILPTTTRLSVSLSDSWLVAMETKSHQEKIGSEIQSAQIQIPTVVERKCEVNRDIPDGTHLLISLGAAVRTQRLTGLPGLVNDLFATIGLAEPMQVVPCERLVLIRPMPIILEAEEQAVRPASYAKPKFRVR
jgi:hypothetical protein